MAWTDVKPFFHEIMEAKQFTLWGDGFAEDNIPANILDHAYHLKIGRISGTTANQYDVESRMPVTISLFVKGYGDPETAIDSAIAETEMIVTEIMRPSNRTNTDGIHNISFIGIDISPLAASNDNAVLASLEFDVRVVLQTLT